jgi:hypothetical protein
MVSATAQPRLCIGVTASLSYAACRRWLEMLYSIELYRRFRHLYDINVTFSLRLMALKMHRDSEPSVDRGYCEGANVVTGGSR